MDGLSNRDVVPGRVQSWGTPEKQKLQPSAGVLLFEKWLRDLDSNQGPSD